MVLYAERGNDSSSIISAITALCSSSSISFNQLFVKKTVLSCLNIPTLVDCFASLIVFNSNTSFATDFEITDFLFFLSNGVNAVNIL